MWVGCSGKIRLMVGIQPKVGLLSHPTGFYRLHPLSALIREEVWQKLCSLYTIFNAKVGHAAFMCAQQADIVLQ